MLGNAHSPKPLAAAWPPEATRLLIALTIGMFIWQIAVFALTSPVLDDHGVILPSAIRTAFADTAGCNLITNYGAISLAGLKSGYWWQSVTNLFLNPDLAAFAFSLILLATAGFSLERIIGRRHLVGLFLAGGTAGVILRLAVEKDIQVLGTSAAACAVAVAATTVLPEQDLRIFAPLRRLPVRVPAKYFAALLLFALVLLFLIDNGPAVSARQLQAGHLAPLAGCFTGWFYARALGFGRRVPVYLQSQPVPALIATGAAAERHETAGLASDPHEFIRDAIDPILEKISREGLDRLTPDERRLLEQASERLPDSSASQQ